MEDIPVEVGDYIIYHHYLGFFFTYICWGGVGFLKQQQYVVGEFFFLGGN